MKSAESKKQVLFEFIILGIVGFSISCSSTPETLYDREKNEEGKPHWVIDGTRTLTASNGRAFISVGSAHTVGAEFALQATKANMRCKNEMEKMVARFISVSARDYLASGAAEPSGFSTQDIEKNIADMTQAVMEHVHVIEHWVDNREKYVYAVSEISYTELMDIITQGPGFNDGFKVFLKKSGIAIFDRIATDHDFVSSQLE